MYYTEFCALITGEADVVLLFEILDNCFVCVADVRPLSLRL